MNGLYELDDIQYGLLQQGIIQIFGEINEETFVYVQKCIVLCESQGQPTGGPLGTIFPKLTFKINSPGGDLHDSLMIYDMIRLYGGTTFGFVIGEAMSGANLILQACDIRIAARSSQLHVHNMLATISLDLMRDQKKFQEEFKELEEWQGQVYAIYRKRTKRTQAELKEIFKKNRAISAKKALALGFIDQIK